MRRQARLARSDAPAATDRTALLRSARRPAARQRQRRDARIGGGEVSFCTSLSVHIIRSPPSARASSASGLRDQLRRKPWPRRSTSWTSITSVAGAILVNAPTLGGWYLLQGQAVAISRTTGIY